MQVRGRQDRAIEFLAVGHLAVDVRGGRRVLGGAAAYSSITASRLGLASAMVTAVGEDFDFFEALEGIEIHYVRCPRSTSFENIYRAGERRQRLLARARPLDVDDVSSVGPRLTADAIVFFCPIAKEMQAPFPHLAARGLCGLAPQGLFRSWDAGGTVHSAAWAGALGSLVGVDFLSFSVADSPDAEELAGRLAQRVPVLAMTEGERGARVYFGGRRFRVPAFYRAPVDPTGAGDVFAASFMVGLREGHNTLDAAQFACCAASFAVEREGVEGTPPDRGAVEERLTLYRLRHRPAEMGS